MFLKQYLVQRNHSRGLFLGLWLSSKSTEKVRAGESLPGEKETMPNRAARLKAVRGWELRTGQTRWEERGAEGSGVLNTSSGWHLRASCLQGRPRGSRHQKAPPAPSAAALSNSARYSCRRWWVSNVIWQLQGTLDNGHPLELGREWRQETVQELSPKERKSCFGWWSVPSLKNKWGDAICRKMNETGTDWSY